MNKKPRRNAITLHVATVILAFGLLAGGISVRSTKFKADPTMSRKSADLFDSRFRPKIGTPYTEDMHQRVVKFAAATDSTVQSTWKAFGSLATAMVVLGSILSIASLANLFLLIRTVPKEP
jgi:hypothetical protein